ncbi:glycosyl hydrolase family 28-related protein [Enterobacter hormaechei]|uniref:glycosyl hydrolase family 28-related protein n=1 Tax=Enterobacter hormaechei TaxID=158836 RepID=UPI0030767EE2
MTVSTVVDHNDYTGNGVTTSFPYTFRIFKKTDLAVSVVDLNENITVLMLDTDYTVTNAGGYNGGNVVLTAPLATGWKISITRELEPTQETDLRNQGKFFAEVHEDAFDKLTMLIQQAFSVFRLALRKPTSIANWYDALNNYIRNVRDPRDPQDAATKNYVDTVANSNISRTLRVPEAINQLPDISGRRNMMPAFDNDGNAIVVAPPSGTASDVFIQLASSADGKGDALVAVKQPLAGSVARTQHNLNADYVNVKDWGAKGDGVTDDTAAINAACSSLTGTSFITNFRRLYFPHGTYVYKGTGIVLPNGTSLIGEDLFTTIDASANTNTGYLITLTGFRSRVDTIALKGNKDNPGMKGISSYYNSDNGGVLNCILEDFHYGIDIDKSWYAVYRNIRFRRSNSTITLNGAHIRIGFNYQSEEVNNIDFSNIWLGEPQNNGVAVYCPTQTLSWNECSFETIGEARVKFFNTSTVNSFCLNHCYIEGGIGSGGVYLVEGQTPNQFIVCNDCTFRLGSTSGSLGKNITIQINGGWTNSPQVYLNQNNAKVWFSRYRYSAGSWADGPNMSATGLWDGTNSNNAAIYLDPRPVEIRDWNSVIPDYVNTKKYITNASTFEIYSAYIPAGNNPRIMRLVLDATHKREAGTDQYNTQWVIAITLQESSSGAGVLISRVFENGTTNAGAGTLTLSCVSNGYDSATDSIKYTISLTAATIGTSLTVLRGAYLHEGALSTLTPKWRIQRK